MQSYCSANKNATLHDLTCYATLLRILQGETRARDNRTQESRPTENTRRSDYQGNRWTSCQTTYVGSISSTDRSKRLQDNRRKTDRPDGWSSSSSSCQDYSAPASAKEAHAQLVLSNSFSYAAKSKSMTRSTETKRANDDPYYHI